MINILPYFIVTLSLFGVIATDQQATVQQATAQQVCKDYAPQIPYHEQMANFYELEINEINKELSKLEADLLIHQNGNLKNFYQYKYIIYVNNKAFAFESFDLASDFKKRLQQYLDK
ncbi:unnamed protein product [Gordionus sp. m RMFG-2023]